MRFLFLAVSFVAAVSAQSLLVYGDNALPTCAQSCAALTNAQSACLPPAAPVTDDVTYESCFCQSGYLTALKSSGSTLCSDVCTDSSDVAQISTWYQSNCADNGVAAAASMSTATTSRTANSASTVASTVASSASTNTASSNSNASANSTKPTGWWPNHWKWVVMVIVIFVGIAIFTVVLILVRRRYHKRQDEARRPFNQGITNNSAPVVAANTPLAASKTSLPRVREKDRAQPVHDPMPNIGEELAGQGRGGTPDIERAGTPGRLRKHN